MVFEAITHNGTETGPVYAIDEPNLMDVDIYQHPRTTMDMVSNF